MEPNPIYCTRCRYRRATRESRAPRDVALGARICDLCFDELLAGDKLAFNRQIDPRIANEHWCPEPLAGDCEAIDARPESQRALEHSFNHGRHVFVPPEIAQVAKGVITRPINKGSALLGLLRRRS